MSGGFSPNWLALREPLDIAARNRDVETAFRAQLPEGTARILDLASGAGSTVAALQPHLNAETQWQLTDYDPALLDVAAARWSGGSGVSVSTRQIDLASDLETLTFEEVDAITTSAFLDLVSEAFLDRLATQIAASGKPFLASLTYDGRTTFSPPHPLDNDLVEALNKDQKSEKGFGPALGPEAAGEAVARLQAKGLQVLSGPSDWQVGPDDRDFLEEFLGGWFRAARSRWDIDAVEPTALEDWYRLRMAQIEAGELSVMVGHVDLVAWT